MMPEPGFQKPMPYLAPADDRKSYTSLFCLMAYARSAAPPNLLSLRHATHGKHVRPQRDNDRLLHADSRLLTRELAHVN